MSGFITSQSGVSVFQKSITAVPSDSEYLDEKDYARGFTVCECGDVSIEVPLNENESIGNRMGGSSAS